MEDLPVLSFDGLKDPVQDCDGAFPPKSKAYTGDWLAETGSVGLLSAEGLQAARRIQRSGNQVAHRGLGRSPIDGDALMSDMGLVLRELLGPGA